MSLPGCGADSSPGDASETSSPAGTTPSGSDTPAAAPSDSRCTTGSFWTRGDHESPLMHPGGMCIDCHSRKDEGPDLTIAGTLFPSMHEQDDCNGVDSSYDAVVVITDANGKESQLKVNNAGNFYIEERAVAKPYHAKIIYNGNERAMAAAQTVGDCNSCHTENGAQGAPGRIYLP
jgi:hypothetical protein